jgi:microsomal epoxide hydrolase
MMWKLATDRDFHRHKHEKEINGFPQFTSQVQVAGGMTMRIHFIALFSQKDDAMPLMMLHGWPGPFPSSLSHPPSL